MITSLSIQNLILIESAQLEFAPGLNLLTGETGSGKSALLMALRLLAGERADPALIRPGAPSAIVEAELDGVLYRRELRLNGKSRAFRDDEQITLADLRALPLAIVDQSASPTLASPDSQQALLDRYADSPIKAYQALYRKGAPSPESLQADLALFDTINPQPQEEASLNAEHQRLSHAHELLERAGAIQTALSETVIPALRRLNLEPLQKLDPTLAPLSTRSSLIELEETSRFLARYLSNLEPNPDRLAQIEARIGGLEQLKRRFGPDYLAERDRLTAALETLESDRLALSLAGEQLTASRTRGAVALQTAIQEQLKDLGLSQARIELALQPTPPGLHGAEQLELLFSANPGHPLRPLSDCASGGELSRLLLALECALADRAAATTLVFDEIDSNVGGETAALVGAKLQTLAKHRQILCVTHFVQVARFAERHFHIAKTSDGTTTRATVAPLNALERAREYERMVAGKAKKPLR